MGTITAGAVINKASLLLFDVNQVKWSQAELLSWLSDGQRATAALLPEAASAIQVLHLGAGARQSLPAGAFMLLEVTRNMGTNGATPGRAVKRVDRAILEETSPDWADAAAVSAPTTYMYNARDKLGFYVSPPADGTGYVELNVALLPAEIANIATVITLSDLYVPALVDYLMWRAKSKMVPFAGDPQDAAAYFQSWAMYVTGDAKAVSKLASEMGAIKETPAQQQGSQGES